MKDRNEVYDREEVLDGPLKRPRNLRHLKPQVQLEVVSSPPKTSVDLKTALRSISQAVSPNPASGNTEGD